MSNLAGQPRGGLTSEILYVSELFIRRWDFGLEILAQIYLFVLLS